ncbi:MAG: hypothetical protein WB952_04040 [Terriglobales bacterium]
MSSSAVHVDPTPNDPQKPNKHWHHIIKTIQWLRSLPGWRILQGIGIIAGVVYAAVTYLQWKDLRNNFTNDERGYVQSVFPTFASNLAENVPIHVNMIFLSGGKTPTRNVMTYGCVAKYPWPRPSTQKEIDDLNVFVDKAFQEAKGQLIPEQPIDHAPGSNFMGTFVLSNDCERFSLVFNGLSLNANELADFSNGRFVLIAIVGAVYMDDFGGKHETQICQYLPPNRGEGWDYCPSHNVLR